MLTTLATLVVFIVVVATLAMFAALTGRPPKQGCGSVPGATCTCNSAEDCREEDKPELHTIEIKQ